MLYLAEIQKQSKGFMGGTETKLKLIACQRNDQSWSIMTNESITIDDGNDFGDGALIVVNLGINRQIQGKIELASQKIIGILKNFSRLLEKTKDQEQEIGQWKESLAIQSEELSRRQIEMETRLEQIEQMEEEFKEFEQQRSEIAATKEETDTIKAEFEAKSAELQGAWEQLRGQQQSLEEQLKQSKVLDETQASTIRKQLALLAIVADSSSSVKSKLSSTVEAVKSQQSILQPHWENLTEHTQNIQAKRQELEQASGQLFEYQQQMQSLNVSIAATEGQLGIGQKALESKQELTQLLSSQSEVQANLLQMLANSESDPNGNQNINLEELENMPLPNLVTTVENLQQDLEKVVRFVNDQEEELGWQCKAVEELEAKIAQAGEFERFTLEQELADELEAKKMLDQTLIGQRRSLKERHQILLQHSQILKRRQGIVDFDSNTIQDIDLEPIKLKIAEQAQKLEKQQQELSLEVSQIEQSVQELTTKLEQQKTEKNELESLINQQQVSWNELNLNVTQLESQIDFYQQQLQPIQDTLDAINDQVSEMEELMANYVTEEPNQAVTEIERIIDELAIN